MSILIARLTRELFKTDSYALLAGRAGKVNVVAQFNGEAPKPLKTADYKLIGDYKRTAKYGKTFVVSRWEKLGAINLVKY